MAKVQQSPYHLVAQAPWSDEALLAEALRRVLPVMQQRGPIVAWRVETAVEMRTVGDVTHASVRVHGAEDAGATSTGP